MEGTYPRERRAIFAPSRIPGSGRHPGFRECVTLRGVTHERGPWSAHEDGGSIQPAARRIDDTQGCSRSSVRRGTFTPVVLSPVMRRSRRREGGSFAQGLLGPCSPALSSNGHRRKRWSDRSVARKRRYGWAVAFGVSSCGVLATPSGRLRKGCRGSQLSWSFFERGRSPRPKRAWRERAHIRPHAKSGRVEARESDARECDRASEVSCRSRWAAVGSREAPVGASREQREARRWAGTGI
jgi:hypothetical protein